MKPVVTILQKAQPSSAEQVAQSPPSPAEQVVQPDLSKPWKPKCPEANRSTNHSGCIKRELVHFSDKPYAIVKVSHHELPRVSPLSPDFRKQRFEVNIEVISRTKNCYSFFIVGLLSDAQLLDRHVRMVTVKALHDILDVIDKDAENLAEKYATIEKSIEDACESLVAFKNGKEASFKLVNFTELVQNLWNDFLKQREADKASLTDAHNHYEGLEEIYEFAYSRLTNYHLCSKDNFFQFISQSSKTAYLLEGGHRYFKLEKEHAM